MTSVKHTPIYYPMFLNISGKRCTVVGGGQVALRKVEMLLEFGASVVVISPELCSELEQFAENGKIQVFRRTYQPGDVEQAVVVIAATSDTGINLAVSEDARRNDTFVNVVDDASISDFIVPSYMRRGNITLAISTNGGSPALARKLRVKLEKEFGGEYARLALLVSEVRSEVKQQALKVDGQAWQDALDIDTLIGLLKEGREDKAKAAILNTLKVRQAG